MDRGANHTNKSNIQITYIQGVLFDELAARFDFVTHQNAEHVIRFADVVHLHLDQRTVIWIQRRFTKLFRVHLAKTLIAGDLDTFFTSRSDGPDQATEIFQSCFRFSSSENKARLFDSCPILWQQGFDIETELCDVLKRRIDRTNFVEFFDL